MSRVSIAAETAARFYTRRHPGYTVAAQHPAYDNGIVVFDSYEIVFVRCSLSHGATFADNNQTREQAEAQAIEWMTANARRNAKGERITCATCRRCIEAKPGDRIAVHAH